MEIPIIHEDKNFIVIDKPAGILVHGGAGVQGEAITDWLRERYPEIAVVGDEPDVRPGIVHRLDKGTSGVMVIARTQDSFEALKQLFKSRSVEKIYLALVIGSPKKDAGLIDGAIGRSLRNPTKRAIGEAARGTRAALTHWKILERFKGYTLVEVAPKTGRMHQIRVHLASIGHPIAGDHTYGAGRLAPEGLSRPFLHAWRLTFSYPEGRRWQFESALPNDLSQILATLRTLRRNT